MLKAFVIVLGALAFAEPVAAKDAQRSAADQKQCEGQFKAADLNNDGVLTTNEIGNVKQTLPSSLVNKNRIARHEFMLACGRSASRTP
jgi:hypothetical protein